MDIKQTKKLIRILALVLVLLFPALMVLRFVLLKPDVELVDTTPRFVGAQNCKECHLNEYNDWKGSHHERAMDVANDSTVLGDFSDKTLEAQGHTYRMFRKEGKFFVLSDGEDGQMHDYEVKYVFGYTPLQQYLVEFDRGRLQTLPITWNTLDKVWYHMADSTYKDQVIDANNWLHWTNQAQNWNGMCAECHSTNLVKGYDAEKDSYHTTWSEINVSCEACHGPGSNHVQWAELPAYSREGFENFGLEVKTSNIDNAEYVNLCMRCHSRKSSLSDMDYSAKSIYDHSRVVLPDEPSWYVDGQIKDEDYVYASFMQSKMYQRGVKCNDCHNVHSGERLFDGNRLCLQCHQKDVYDTYSHHHHKSAGMPGKAVISESGVKFDVGSGTECINCHMHGRYYMGVDYRRDHSFRIPRPDLSIKNGTPNACNQCHVDQTNQWSDKYITEWFGSRRRFHYSQAFAAAKDGKTEAASELKEIAGNDLYPPNIRSLALQDLGAYYPDTMAGVVDNYLVNLDPSLRLVAMASLQQGTPENISRLIDGLTDDTKAVRTEAAANLLRIGSDQVPEKNKSSFNKALEEYKEVLLYSADFPTGKINMANFYYHQSQFAKAEQYYKAALEQDGEMYFVNLNLAYLYNQTRRNDLAEKHFRIYLEHQPDDAGATYALGLVLSELGRYDESLAVLLKASKIDPNYPRVNHNIAMLYDFMKDKSKAESYLLKEVDAVQDLNSRLELLQFYLTNSNMAKATTLGDEILKLYPDNEDVKQLMARLRGQS
ncbi:multiheme c-type cytochrome [Mangrovibacterium diazotrophicum]|uniref:Tfp pilus assembly protein PilF n=1 Tax=Mangrovibacterium diazotrophicum TaxID=1261403 RepID=A0A419W4D5_9BACT|nr:multiheme c-type cytochrome [Mangrovibacterium diazotrophicum]RKD90314.1 Tfp pilus assembly protein PilF [Mangrovibacterium diazotrophicum]